MENGKQIIIKFMNTNKDDISISWDVLIPVYKKCNALASQEEDLFHSINNVKDALLSANLNWFYLELIRFINYYDTVTN